MCCRQSRIGLRRWSVARRIPEGSGEDGALFRFLNLGKRSVVVPSLAFDRGSALHELVRDGENGLLVPAADSAAIRRENSRFQCHCSMKIAAIRSTTRHTGTCHTLIRRFVRAGFFASCAMSCFLIAPP